MTNLPFAFGLRVFLGIFIPGLIGGTLFYLFRGQAGRLGNLEQEGLFTFIVLSGVLGLALTAVLPLVAPFICGITRWWPLRSRKVRRLEARLREAEEILKKKPPQPTWRYNWASQYVQYFPMSQSGERFVATPTIPGNILVASLGNLAIQHGVEFLESPALGQHMVFTLTRLWFALPQQARNELSNSLTYTQAVVGSMIAMSIGLCAFLTRSLFEVFQVGRVYLDIHSWTLAGTGAFLYGLIAQIGKSPAAFPLGFAALLLVLLWFAYFLLTQAATTAAIVLNSAFGYVSPAELQQILTKVREEMKRRAEEIAAQRQADTPPV